VAENQGKLERGRVKLALIRDLAAGDETQTMLAAKYGVDQGSISKFASRHAIEIQGVIGKLDDRFAGLWIADKANRIAEYQQMIADIDAIVEASTVDGRVNIVDADVLRTKLATLRQVAEELGQLPARVTVKHEGAVKMIVEGVDLANLT
jgi:hypothetical protein